MAPHLALADALSVAVKAALLARAQPLQDRIEQLEPLDEMGEIDYDTMLERVADGDDGAIDEIIAKETASADEARAFQIRAEAASILRGRVHKLLSSEDQALHSAGQWAAAIMRLADSASVLRRQGREISQATVTAQATLDALRVLFDRLAPEYDVAPQCRALYDLVLEEWSVASGQRRAA